MPPRPGDKPEVTLSPAERKPPSVRKTVSLPLRDGSVSADVITFDGLTDAREHVALGFGDYRAEALPTVRMHSECLTGDVFGSAKCDCGAQLHEAMTILNKASGILLYLRQEGRGIGLYNKIDAYDLQTRGMDTYEANRHLGFPDDPRDFRCAAEMLFALGKTRIRLISNNPEKAHQLAKYGIEVVERVPTSAFVTLHNFKYLSSKVRHTKHSIDLGSPLDWEPKK